MFNSEDVYLRPLVSYHLFPTIVRQKKYALLLSSNKGSY